MFKGQSSKICRHVSNWRHHGTSDWILNNRWGGDCLIDNRLSNVYFVGYFTNNISNELGASYWNDHFINFFFMYNSQIQLDISSWYMCNVNVCMFDIFILSHGHGWVYSRRGTTSGSGLSQTVWVGADRPQSGSLAVWAGRCCITRGMATQIQAWARHHHHHHHQAHDGVLRSRCHSGPEPQDCSFCLFVHTTYI